MSHEYRLGRLNGDFVVTWWEDGKRRRHRLFTAKESHELRRDKREAERRFANFTKVAVATKAPIVAELWDAYRADKSGRRVAVAMMHEWKAMEAHFGHLRADEVTDAVCRAYTAKRRAAGKKDGTIWTELGHLRSVFNWAVDKRAIPFAPAVERPTKPAPKERHLTRAECRRLILAAKAPHVRLAIILMLATAARVGAILDLTWERVDLERGQIRLRRDDSVTRKGRATVPVNESARAALVKAKEAAMSDYVIEWGGDRVGSIKTGFNRAVADAGLVNVSPHVLRHTAAVQMAEAGVSMDMIAQYLGHDDSRITQKVYARFQPGHMAQAAAALNFVDPDEV